MYEVIECKSILSGFLSKKGLFHLNWLFRDSETEGDHLQIVSTVGLPITLSSLL